MNALQALLLPEESLAGRYSVTLGLGRFFDPDTANPFCWRDRSDRSSFTIWVTVLLAIGLSITGMIPGPRPRWRARSVWLIGALLPYWAPSALMG